MSGEDHVSIWVNMQQKVWHGDTQSKARFITLKDRATDEIVFRCPAEADNIAIMVKEFLALQAAELPAKSTHAFVLIASDDAGVQLSALPQTIRGTNHEAQNAAQEQIQMANAHAKTLANLDTLNQIATRNAELLAENLATAIQDKFAVLDQLVTERATNHKDELEHDRYLREQARRDKIFDAFSENFMPIAGMIVKHKVEKFLKENPDMLGDMLGGKPNATGAATEKLPDEPSVSVVQSGPPSVPATNQASSGSGGSNGKGRGKGNSRSVPV
jgi:hypothetical protein